MSNSTLPTGSRSIAEIRNVSITPLMLAFMASPKNHGEYRQLRFIGKANEKGMIKVVFLDGSELKIRQSYRVLVINRQSENQDAEVKVEEVPSAPKGWDRIEGGTEAAA